MDIDLAFTFLRTAEIEADLDPQHSENAIEKARVALSAIRQLVERVEDPAVRARIRARPGELEAAINRFST